MVLRQQISDDEMLRETVQGMKAEQRIFLREVPVGAKFVVVHMEDSEPDWLKERPTKKTMEQKYLNLNTKEYRPLLKVDEGDKFFLWDPDNGAFILGGRTLLVTMHGTYGPEELEQDEDD